MSKVKCELCEGRDEVTNFLNELKSKGHNLSNTLLSITQDRMYYTIFYIDIFDTDK